MNLTGTLSNLVHIEDRLGKLWGIGTEARIEIIPLLPKCNGLSISLTSLKFSKHLQSCTIHLFQERLLNPGHSRSQTMEHSGATGWGREKKMQFSSSGSAKVSYYVFLSNNTIVPCWDTFRSERSICLRDQIGRIMKERGKEKKCLSVIELMALVNCTIRKGRTRMIQDMVGVLVLVYMSVLITNKNLALI